MKIALAQQNYSIGDFGKNASKILLAIFEARKQGADMIVFPELSVCGSFPYDLLLQEDFMETTMQTLQRIATETYGIIVLVGCPSYCSDETEKKVYDSVLLIENGTITRRFNKKQLTHIEQAHFITDNEPNYFEFKHKKIAVCVGNDAPEDIEGISLAINCTATPFVHKKTTETSPFSKCTYPVISVNQCGANTEDTYEGHSFVCNEQGQRIIQLPYFESTLSYFETEKEYQPLEDEQPNAIALLHDALVMGIRDYFAKNNFKTATLGLSGGIDSAVVLALAAEAIGTENIRVLLLPSEFSTSHSITDAEALAKKLNIVYDIVPIKQTYDTILNALSPLFGDLPFSVAEENLQSRIRGVLLMAVSNKFGNILLNTSNKSEIAVGYGTLYGDTNGSLSVLGDVYKTDVYALAQYINRDKEIIPNNTITKAPSAELRYEQQDSDSLPDYDTLDTILYAYIEAEKSESELYNMNVKKETIDKILHLVKRCEFKRQQLCPAIKVSEKPLSQRHIPLIAKF